MGVWIMGILGVICVSVLVDIFLPDGQTNKYVKGIFSIITLYVVISPLPAFLSKDYSISDYLNFEAADITVDENFLNGLFVNPHGARERALCAHL